MGETCGFSNMLGNMGDHSKMNVIFEADDSRDLWIWHTFFGILGSSSDINVLNQSNVFNGVLAGRASKVHYVINRI